MPSDSAMTVERAIGHLLLGSVLAAANDCQIEAKVLSDIATLLAQMAHSEDGSEMTDVEKLAQWFDVRDAQSGITDNRKVQSDLRRIAARITALETRLARE